MNRLLVIVFLVCLGPVSVSADRHPLPQANLSGIYADQEGVLRWKDNGQEAVFFGVNYTVPFAYGYRSHRKLGIDHEKAIDRDVYHLARLGVNAFRVHVWDTEISDSLGDLKENEHLRLFDYLIARLQERGVYTLITPIAFWGNGYPDPDEKTGSFSELYGKDRTLTEEKAFVAQERYLKQFFNHVNPYTKRKYGDDPWVVAAEVNNEPHHSGPKSRTTEYINRMLAAIKSTGWSKPVFYNISESPAYADAVTASAADGFSFQWYPTGLVSGHTLQGNFLPNVDHYCIPFDTIPAFKGKPLIVYEFDGGDVMQPYMYPAMARSFRTAGFRWATQFAYDPLATAYANTEYQTHYLNLAYTPSKAISLLIAGKVFRQLPAFRSYGVYPADTIFGPFRLSYVRRLSEMNSAEEYYYSNTTESVPVQPASLKHIAGVGSSPIVAYAGNGAYFLDKVAAGVWRLEVMPDVISLRDPFERTSPDREVTRTVNRQQDIRIRLDDLGAYFTVKGLNEGNRLSATASSGAFRTMPGIYLLERKNGKKYRVGRNSRIGYIGMAEFVAPDLKPDTIVVHQISNVPGEPEAGVSALYIPGRDESYAAVYAGQWGSNRYEYTTDAGGQTALHLQHQQQEKEGFAALDVYIGNRIGSLSPADTLIVTATGPAGVPLKITLADRDAVTFSATVPLTGAAAGIRVPLTAFRPDSLLLMPRPYPGFQPLHFTSGKGGPPDLKHLEKLQLTYPVSGKVPVSVRFGPVYLKPSH